MSYPASSNLVTYSRTRNGTSRDDVLVYPSERKDSSDRPSQRETTTGEHDEDQYPKSRQHVSTGQSLAARSYQRHSCLPRTGASVSAHPDEDVGHRSGVCAWNGDCRRQRDSRGYCG